MPASSNLSVVLPVAVSIWIRRTWAPTAVALGVIVIAALVTGWSKSTRSHCPTAACSALDTHAVAGSPSIAAAAEAAGAASGIAVESDEELDTVIRPPVQLPNTLSAPGTG